MIRTKVFAVEGRILTGRMILRVAGDCERLISPLARRLLFLRTDAIDDFVRNRQPPNDIPRAESSARNPYGTRAGCQCQRINHAMRLSFVERAFLTQENS
ncbi:hypothetical protein CDAR_73351 [Caerostris darwini]|uniref:Uncharacterized protein n=1 Tax=Caerostris darwini TaxID=1538125 RepID=A0AAV4VKA2_9ARAC|nr:hypothetical protein CDAR_73351 [Caerostris darwini]